MGAVARLLATLALGMSLASAAQAGAWPQEQGRWLIVNQFTFSDTATKGYDNQGRPAGNGSLKQFEFSPYIEYGVTPEWTLGLQPRFQVAHLSAPVGQKGASSASGLAEVNLFSRYTLYRWDYDVLAVQAMLGVPGFAGKNMPTVAAPWPEYEARLLYGHSFDFGKNISAFFDTEVAYRLEGGHNADQIHSDTTFGFRPDSDWLAMLQFNATWGLANNTGSGSNYDQYRLSAAIGRRVGADTWLLLGGYTDLGGRNVSLGNGVTVSIWTKF